MHILPDLQEYARHARILTEREYAFFCDSDVLLDAGQHILCNRPCLFLRLLPDAGLDIFSQIMIRLYTKLGDLIRNTLYV